MPKTPRVLLVAVGATAAVVLGAIVVRSPDDRPDRRPTAYESTPLTAYDTDGVAVTRASFCEAVPAGAVVQALGGEPESATAYDNGERARLGPGLRDVAHEYACAWMSPGATLRAWVFAPPVTIRAARQLARTARTADDCVPAADAPDYGRPSTALVCRLGEREEASYRGLYGDAWLTCTLSTQDDLPRDELLDRAGRWCVAVVEAARAS